jgi:hypothetical protein
MKIKRLPRILALHLKRFKFNERLNRFTKLFYRVSFPLELRLSGNVSTDSEDPDRLYNLFAIVVHIGNGPTHGHYIAVVKTGGRWWIFDDQLVDEIDESLLARLFGPGENSSMGAATGSRNENATSAEQQIDRAVPDRGYGYLDGLTGTGADRGPDGNPLGDSGNAGSEGLLSTSSSRLAKRLAELSAGTGYLLFYESVDER